MTGDEDAEVPLALGSCCNDPVVLVELNDRTSGLVSRGGRSGVLRLLGWVGLGGKPGGVVD
jgi:hypothetical protein